MTLKIVFDTELPLWAMLLLFGGALIICYVTGYFWLKFNFDRMQMQVSQSRNPLINDLHTLLVKNKGEKL